MPTFEEARSIILAHVSSLGVEPVMLLDSVGRVLGEDVAAPWNMPSCSNSAMDGYAVRAADCGRSQVLPIIDYIPAGGCASIAVEPGTAIKIMTGAPIPEGCDSVVPLEDARESDAGTYISGPVRLYQHIRFAGEDIKKGEVVLRKGTVLRPIDISVLASFSSASATVFRKPTIAIVATGDELVELGEIPPEGKIVNCNSYSLAAAIKLLGCTPIILGIACDTLESHRQKLAKGLKADALITSAGVSVGDRDLVREVLGELGVEQVFWGVDVKPGKSLAFGVNGSTPVFSLPGNPVSTMLTFEEFVVPALLKMMGRRSFIRPLLTAELEHEVTKLQGRTQLVRVQVKYSNGKYLACSAGKQATGYMKTLIQANAIAILPAKGTVFAVGDPVQVHFLDSDIWSPLQELHPTY